METHKQRHEADAAPARQFTKNYSIYKPRRDGGGCASGWELNTEKEAMFLVAAALFAMLMMVAVAQPLHVFLRATWLSLQDTWRALIGA